MKHNTLIGLLFGLGVGLFCGLLLNNNLKFVGIYADDTFSRGSLVDVWNEYWANYNMGEK